MINIDGILIDFVFNHEMENGFIGDLYKFWKTEVPFFIQEMEVLMMLYRSKKNYFRIPARKTYQNKDIYFYFEVIHQPKNERVKWQLYKYTGFGYDEPV